MTFDAMMVLAPCAKMLAVFAVARVGWMTLGDVILEHVGIPFLDAGWRRDEVPATVAVDTPDREAVARVVRWIERPAGVCVRLSFPDRSARRAA
jgi:hypothetical protein